MGTMIDIKTGKDAQSPEPFTRVFEYISLETRKELREAGAQVKRIHNDTAATNISPLYKMVQQVTFPAGTREEVRMEHAGWLDQRHRNYYLPNGQVYSEYKQGVESCSLRRAEYMERR